MSVSVHVEIIDEDKSNGLLREYRRLELATVPRDVVPIFAIRRELGRLLLIDEADLVAIRNTSACRLELPGTRTGCAMEDVDRALKNLQGNRL